MSSLQEHIGKVIEGDCLEVMPFLPDGCIDMIVCDLPYGTTINPWDVLIDFSQLWAQYKRLIKSNGVIALTGAGLFTARLILSNPDWFNTKSFGSNPNRLISSMLKSNRSAGMKTFAFFIKSNHSITRR